MCGLENEEKLQIMRVIWLPIIWKFACSQQICSKHKIGQDKPCWMTTAVSLFQSKTAWKPFFVFCFEEFNKIRWCISCCALAQLAEATKSTDILNMWPANKWIIWPWREIGFCRGDWRCCCSAVTQNVCLVLPKNSPSNDSGQGRFVSARLQGLLNCS